MDHARSVDEIARFFDRHLTGCEKHETYQIFVKELYENSALAEKMLTDGAFFGYIHSYLVRAGTAEANGLTIRPDAMVRKTQAPSDIYDHSLDDHVRVVDADWLEQEE